MPTINYQSCDPFSVTINGIEYELKPISKEVGRDYEILSFKNNFGVIIPSTNSLVKLYSYPIYSVKRLSDNEVFTIGDTVYWYPEMNCVITKLTEFGFIPETKKLNVYGEGFEVDFSLIKKVQSKVALFTTVDGKEIFESDVYFYVQASFRITEYNATLNGSYPKNYTSVCFSTMEKANEYVLMNKPCLSLNDIINCEKEKYAGYNITMIEELKKLVKQKINV